MAEPDRAVPEREAAPSRPEYEVPSLEVLGTLEELTQGTSLVGGDLNTMVITF